MVRAGSCVGSILLLIVVGCTRDEDYLEVARQQRAAWVELADILATVRDEKSMANAKTALDEKTKHFEGIAHKAAGLPKPPPPGALKRLQEDELSIKATLARLESEVKRVSKLQGGEEFLNQFKSRSPGLFSAVKP